MDRIHSVTDFHVTTPKETVFQGEEPFIFQGFLKKKKGTFSLRHNGRILFKQYTCRSESTFRK